MGFYGGFGGMQPGSSNSMRAGKTIDHAVRTQVKELERKVHRLELEHRAMWEMIRDATKFTDADLEARVKEIDLRDGVEDSQITAVPLRCPACKRVASSKHWRCLYCGQDFEKYAY